MQFTPPQRNSNERITASYYIVESPWWNKNINSVATGLRGVNLRGLCVSWVRSTLLQATAPIYGSAAAIGSVTIGTGADDSCQDMVLGVLDSNIILGQDDVINRWVNVVVYGYTDRIATADALASNDDYLVMQETNEVGAPFNDCNRGFAVGYSRPSMRAPTKLSGRVLITLVTPADTDQILINLDGTSELSGSGGTSIWTIPPGAVHDQLVGADGAIQVRPADTPVIAMRTNKTPTVPVETVTGGTGIPLITEGFVTCFGVGSGTVG